MCYSYTEGGRRRAIVTQGVVEGSPLLHRGWLEVHYSYAVGRRRCAIVTQLVVEGAL